MSDFEFYKSKEVYGEKYYQLPKVFFTNELYLSMSNDSKVAYAILKDRFEYSIRNNWVDEDDNIYFIYTVQELMSLLNCREGKISSIKKELEKAGLLFQKRCGSKFVDGVKKNLPNRLYLGKPQVEAHDVYLINSGIANIANPQESIDSNVSSGIANIANPQESIDSNVSSGIANIANNLYLPSIDTLKEDTKKIDTEKERQQQAFLLANYSDTQDHSILNKSSLEALALFSDTVEEASHKQGIILNAKRKAEKDNEFVVVAEEWHDEIDMCLRRVLQKIKTDHKIKNADNFMFRSFYNQFTECILQKKAWLNQSVENDVTVTTYDWLEN